LPLQAKAKSLHHLPEDHVIVGLTTFTVPEVGDAEIVTTGIGGLTVTVALVFAEPPGPEHEIE
jgi:hypothetical protein